jgi:predicted transcriptional regulator
LSLWPYILPLPRDREDQRKLFLTVFGSNTAMDILQNLSIERKVYQRDLIKKLGHSNKTIIEKLKTFVALGILEETMEKSMEGGKVVWLKCYRPTNLGRWIILLLMPPEGIDAKVVEKTLRELFELYVKNAVKLCRSFGLDIAILRKIFEAEMNRDPFSSPG